MAYKTELHCHSKPVSICGERDAAQIAEAYAAAGYATVVLMNHINYNVDQWEHLPTWNDKVDYFLEDYHDLKKAAEGKLNILWGVELRLEDGNANDYLIYGITEEFLRRVGDLRHYPLKELSELLRGEGFLFAMAHPFRTGITLRNPALFDGIEVYNGHTHHNSRNYLARALAEKEPHLILLSGNDYHHLDQPLIAGIETETPITTDEELLAVLRNGTYTLLKNTALVED